MVHFIATDAPEAAVIFGEKIIDKVGSLSLFPRLGRMVPEFQNELIREIILSPNRVIYEINDEIATLSVLRSWHGARGGGAEVSK